MRAQLTGLTVRTNIRADLPDVFVDSDQIDQVFTNLLDNAVHYSPPGGEIQISASPFRDVVQVRVTDQGSGIAEQDRARVFEAFYRGGYADIARALTATLGDFDLAQEAADEAMVRAYVRWDKIRSYDNPGGWVYRVGLNWARSTRRRLTRALPFHERRVVDPPAGDGISIGSVCGQVSPRSANALVNSADGAMTDRSALLLIAARMIWMHPICAVLAHRRRQLTNAHTGRQMARRGSRRGRPIMDTVAMA
jgi:DNA-directed RNA polymerase specialized sigma24 family protein